MFLLMASAHPECLLWTLAVIFVLYVVWDVLAMRERILSYDPSLAGVPRATAAQIWNNCASSDSSGRLSCHCKRMSEVRNFRT